MTLPRDAMLDLMAYADGELEGDDRTRVEELLASSPEAQRVVAQMRSLGDEVRFADGQHAARLDVADAIAHDVMAKIGPGAPHAAEMGELVSLAQRRSASRARATAAVIGVLALAAGALLFLRSGPSRSGPVASKTPRATPSSTGPIASPAETATADLAANAATEVDLEEVESAEHRVSVFYVPKGADPAGGSSPSSVVIWIDDHATMGAQ